VHETGKGRENARNNKKKTKRPIQEHAEKRQQGRLKEPKNGTEKGAKK
jgi:hypothetical protein